MALYRFNVNYKYIVKKDETQIIINHLNQSYNLLPTVE